MKKYPALSDCICVQQNRSWRGEKDGSPEVHGKLLIIRQKNRTLLVEVIHFLCMTFTRVAVRHSDLFQMLALTFFLPLFKIRPRQQL